MAGVLETEVREATEQEEPENVHDMAVCFASQCPRGYATGLYVSEAYVKKRAEQKKPLYFSEKLDVLLL